MTDEELAAIKARAEAATPGPWYASTVDSVGGGTIYEADWEVAYAKIYPNDIANDPRVEGHLPAFPSKRINTDANAAFIAHAREDIPALLDEVERMREIVRVVANFDDDAYPDGAYCCHWCGAMYDGVGDAPTDHTPECQVSVARAILGQ